MIKRIELDTELLNGKFKELYENGHSSLREIYQQYKTLTGQLISFEVFQRRTVRMLEWNPRERMENLKKIKKENVLQKVQHRKEERSISENPHPLDDFIQRKMRERKKISYNPWK